MRLQLRELRWIACALLAACSLAQAAEEAKPGDADAGRKTYTSYCARCHGINMMNNGSSFDLRTFPKDDRPRFVRSVTQGYKAMPAWGDTFSVDDLSNLWAFIIKGRD